VAPNYSNVTVLSNFTRAPMASALGEKTIETSAPTPAGPVVADTTNTGPAIPVTRGENLSEQPAHLLSFARYQKPAPAAPTAAPEPEKNRQSKRQWAVQVAAVTERKDAETMANELRSHGYDAYVVTAQIATNTWYRVRVGQFAELGAANRLKEALLNASQFKRAYVAAN
jgi:DedD protein